LVFEPGEVEMDFTAGESREASLNVSYDGELSLGLAPVYGVIEGGVLPGDNVVQYRNRLELAGSYLSEAVTASALDRYGLYRGRVDVPYRMFFNVYPRVSAVVLEALEFLEGAGSLDLDAYPTSRIGEGLDYAESREYVPGDNPRYIDWSATARLDRLIVKRYYGDQSGSIHFVYEPGFSDRVSGDRLAAGFLEAVLSYAELGWGIGLTAIDGGEVLFHSGPLRPVEAVQEALRIVNMGDLEVFKSLYGVLDPAPGRRLGEVLGSPVSVGSVGLGVVRDDLASLVGGLVMVSCLVGDPVYLLDLLDVAGFSDAVRLVYEPCVPWRSVSGLEEAVELFGHYERVNRSLSGLGVGVAVDLDEAHGLLLGDNLLFSPKYL
jgi:hypothetical protein